MCEELFILTPFQQTKYLEPLAALFPCVMANYMRLSHHLAPLQLGPAMLCTQC